MPNDNEMELDVYLERERAMKKRTKRQPVYTVEPGRGIAVCGKVVVRLQNQGADPVWVDNLTTKIVRLLNENPTIKSAKTKAAKTPRIKTMLDLMRHARSKGSKWFLPETMRYWNTTALKLWGSKEQNKKTYYLFSSHESSYGLSGYSLRVYDYNAGRIFTLTHTPLASIAEIETLAAKYLDGTFKLFV